MVRRYILQKSTTQDGWWTLTDTQDGWWTLTDTQEGLVCRFKEYEFNDTQKFTFLDSDREVIEKHGPEGLARLVRELTDWGATFHYNILMPAVEIPPRLAMGKQVRYWRMAAGLTVRQLAELSGVTYQNIAKIEAGKYNVSIDILGKIAGALGKKIIIG